MAVTQADVAQVAGVARRTVSNVINDFPYVSDEVRSRVKAAIEELGYQPNRTARSLRIGRTNTLGLALPELDVGYFAEIGRLLVEEAESLGYTVLISQTLGHAEREAETLAKFASQQVDGVLFSAINIEADQVLAKLKDIPVVVLGEHLIDTTLDRMMIDNIAAADRAVSHLAEIGRNRIAFLGFDRHGGSPDMPDLRHRGYLKALRRAGLKRDRALEFAVVGYHRQSGYEAAERLIASGAQFDAVFCATDMLALGCLRALADAGLEVPGQVAVVGFDDLDESNYANPRLSTIAPDKRRLARVATRLIADRIDGSDTAPPSASTFFELVVRESSVGR